MVVLGPRSRDPRGRGARWAEVVRWRVVWRVALRVVEGRARTWARGVRVVGSDVDRAAGVAAVRVVVAGRWEYGVVLELGGDGWRVLGGGGGSRSAPLGSVEVLELGGSSGVAAGERWIMCTAVHVGPGVAHVLVGERRLDVPPGREVTAVWASARHAQGRGTRPLVVALGRDGAELSRIGPHDVLDSHTWRRLADEL